jgi:hypothetical protein
MTQFVAAFDNIVIKRYNESRVSEYDVHVGYVYAPKQRVLHDLTNKAQTLTLPVVAVSISSLSRDSTRLFNKTDGMYFTRAVNREGVDAKLGFARMPVPVNVVVNMSIITTYQLDMDQILSNFVPYSNPYIIISWKLPETVLATPMDKLREIRSEVLWSESVSISYPIDINAAAKYRVVADTSFTIKGWLFKKMENPISNIFVANSKFYNTRILTSYDDLSSMNFSAPLGTTISNSETVSVSGAPHITNFI